MKTARKRLGELVRAVNDDTVSVEIVGKDSAAVLISTKRYAALQEASFLLRSPELMDSLRREMQRALLEAAQERTVDDAAPQAASSPSRRKSKKKKKRKKRR